MSERAGVVAARSGPGPWIIGASFGAAHAFSESTVLGLFGLGLTWRDTVVLSLVATVAGALAAGLIALLVHTSVRSEPRRRAALVAGLSLAEIGLAVELGATGSGLGLCLLGAAVGSALLAIAAEASSRVAPWTRGALLVSITAAAAASTLASDAPRLGMVTAAAEGAFRWSLLGGVGVAAAIGLVLVVRRAGDRSTPGYGPWLTLTALPTLLYLTLLPQPLRSHLRLRPAAEAAGAELPDVVFIVLDTVRADHLELFGHERETMPALTRFALEECAVKMPSLSTAPSSLPSHASMFSGQYSTRHGGHKPFLAHFQLAREQPVPPPPSYAYSIRKDAPMLAERLRDAGYQTAGFAANFGVLGAFGLDRGFEHYDVAPGPPYIGRRTAWIAKWRLFGRKPGGLIDRLLPESYARRTALFTDRVPDYRRAEEINAQASRWLADRDERPSFLFLNYFDAHDPYLPVPERDAHFMEEPEGLSWVGFPKQGYSDFLDDRRRPSPEEIEWMRAQYDAEMLYLDGELEDMFSRLRDAGRWENSMVIVTSDHGEGFWEHGFLRHSTTLYDSQVGVPMLIKLPGTTRRESPAPEHFQTVDLLPTILAELGLPVPEDIDGSPWAAGRDSAMAEVFCHHPEEPRLQREMTAVVQGRLKYIMVYHQQTGDVDEEAYDLAVDPDEQHDLLKSPTPPDVQHLREIAEGLNGQRDAALQRWLLEGDGEADEALLESLRAMGYLTGEDEE